MKKKLLILLLLLPFLAKSQEVKTIIKNYKGIEIVGSYSVRKTKEGKTEYGIYVNYKNISENNVFFKKNNKAQYLGEVYLKGKRSYVFPIIGANEKRGKVKMGMLRKGETYESFIYFPWYENPEVPEFIFEINENATLEIE